tara:strand:- start:295751 stop:296830 length:1080 start_codon:yes stop_codon:yes gene_type:complete
MKRWIVDILAILFVAVVVGWVGMQYGRQSVKGHSGQSDAIVGKGVPVQVRLAREGVVPFEIVGYGQVGPIPGAVNVYSVPLESKVDSILTTTGQRISKGTVLMRVMPSPDTLLMLNQAAEDVAYADREFELVSQRVSMKLATESELIQAENVKKRAQRMLDNLQSRGLSKITEILAQEDGIVSDLPWSPGAIIPPGSPLAMVIPIGQLQVNLWIETDEISGIRIGDEVALDSIEQHGVQPQRMGTVRTIAHQVDPATRLVNVAVDLSDDGYLLGQYVKGTIKENSPVGLIIPRSALVAKPNAMVIYHALDGQAKEIVVQLIAQSTELAVVRGDGLDAQSQVVVQGSAGLSDGTKIEVLP